ncbi:MAG: LapA family protein [Acidimicrobiia bacterium]
MTNGINDMDAEEPDRSSDVEATTETEKTAPVAAQERVFAGTGLFWGLIVGVILAVAVVILAAQNTDTATISFLAWDFSTPLIVLILGSLLIGIVLDELFGLVYRKGRRRTLRDKDQLERLRGEQ